MNLAAELQLAVQHLQASRLPDAEAACDRVLRAAPQFADAWRVRGMIARKSGDLELAEQALRRAVNIQPGHSEALNSLGLILAQTGRRMEAKQCYADALASVSNYAAARINLARLHLSEGAPRAALETVGLAPQTPALRILQGEALTALARPDEARPVLEAVVREQPNDLRGRYALAGALIELGAYQDALDALAPLDASITPQVDVARLRALFGLGELEQAVVAGERALANDPSLDVTLSVLAQIHWMRGDAEAIPPMFEAALEQAGSSVAVQLRYARVLLQMDEAEAALAVLDRVSPGDRAGVHALRADIHIERGEADRALSEAEAAYDADRSREDAQAALVRACLMTGEFRRALGLARAAHSAAPLNQFWIAMQSDALAGLGDPEYGNLLDFDSMAQAYELPAPRGYATITEFNARLAERLTALHAYERHPLDQSLRFGVQTHADLRFSADPVIRAFLETVQGVIEAHVGAMPNAPDHPLFGRRGPPPRIVAAWSVMLGPEGRHVSHVHPEGWLSSAYYVDVPPQVAGAADREGWLKLGEPPFKIPGAHARHFIEPKPGRLALFPSYMWHGTEPIRSGRRLTIAFDVRPEPVSV